MGGSLPDDWAERRHDNQTMWDERVPIHVGSEFYAVDDFLRSGDSLHAFEPFELGDVAGADLVHLQCHFGLDTLSWARRGATVWGIDFSPAAIGEARGLAERAGIEQATFVESDVYDAVEALGGRDFDVVYVSLGAVCWLPDVPRWAGVVGDLLRPGGRFYLVEAHPILWMFGYRWGAPRLDYFHDPAGWTDDDGGTYADPDAATEHNRSHEWQHPLGEVVTALGDQGILTRRITEHAYSPFRAWDEMEERGRQHYVQPHDLPQVPLMYSLRADKLG